MRIFVTPIVLLCAALTVRPSLLAQPLVAMPPEAPHAAPRIMRLSPADGARRVCPDTTLVLHFEGPVTLAAMGKIVVRNATGAVAESVDLSVEAPTRVVGGTSYRYRPVLVAGDTATVALLPGVLAYGKTYTVTVDSGCFLAAEGVSPAESTDTAVVKLKPLSVDAGGGGPGGADAKGGLGVVSWTFHTRDEAPEPDAKMLQVEADSSGDFCTVQGAIDWVRPDHAGRMVIRIGKGWFEELIHIPKGKNRLTLQGVDRRGTAIGYANNARFGGSARQAVWIEGADAVLENLTVRNTTAKGGSQAEALRVNAEHCLLRDADFSSFQDTLRMDGTVYMKNCFVEGDVDFIWGGGSVYLDSCRLLARRNGYLVQARNEQNHPGYLFADCRIETDPSVQSYALARIEPIRFPFSEVVFLHCAMGPGISPLGWKLDSPPKKPAAPGEMVKAEPTPKDRGKHLRFLEYQSTDLDGRLLGVSQRLPESRQLGDAEAAQLRDPVAYLGGWYPLRGEPKE